MIISPILRCLLYATIGSDLNISLHFGSDCMSFQYFIILRFKPFMHGLNLVTITVGTFFVSDLGLFKAVFLLVDTVSEIVGVISRSE